MIIKFIEILRIAGVGIGVFHAYSVGTTPQQVLHFLCPWLLVSVAGSTGIE